MDTKSLNTAVGGAAEKTDAQCPLKGGRRNSNGSTIVGVLAAFVFIGIVVAGMLKNTGSQSAVSRGYGAAMEMSSTVSSGIVATEGFFLANPEDKAKDILDNMVTQQDGDYVYGGGGQKRRLSASSEQYFSSRIAGPIPPPGPHNVRAGVVIAAGKNAKGKEAKSARVFYEFGGFAFVVDVPPVTNAVFSAGEVKDANMAMTVTNGGATFLSNVTFQNAAAVFDQTAYFGGNVNFPSSSSPTFRKPAYFMGKATFQSAATFDNAAYFSDSVKFGAAATFNSDVYFGGSWTKFEGNSVTFNGRAGFDGNIETNATLSAPKDRDIYMNGNFTSSSNGKFVGAGLASQVVYYSGTVTANTKSKFTNITQGSSTNGMTALNKLKGISAANAALMTPPTVEKQTDPQLSMQPVYDAAAAGSVKILNAKDAMTSNGSTFDINTLTTAYKNALANPSSLYMGKYMVVEVTSNISFTANSGTLDANIIYIVKDGGTLDASKNFYSNTKDATTSTLVYAGAGNAKLAEFGSNGPFRGFIYIDEDNTAQNSISFSGANAKLTGAVHNFATSKPLVWNTGSTAYSMPIDFNSDVLGDFGALYNAKTGNLPPNGVVLNPDGITVRPLGYYFY